MSRNACLLYCFVFISLAPPVMAEQTFQSGPRQVHMLELYTSEGCSSCPPAEQWFSKLIRHPRLWTALVPIALHVDYWDHLGWQDRFASAENSQRQRDYQRQGYAAAVYTPGFFWNGEEWRGWYYSLRGLLKREPLQLDDTAEVGRLNASLDGSQMVVRFTPTVAIRAKLAAHIAVLGVGVSQQVQAGENANRTLNHNFVAIKRWQHPLQARDADFQWQGELEMPALQGERLGLAIWVSSIQDARPIQATGGWLSRP